MQSTEKRDARAELSAVNAKLVQSLREHPDDPDRREKLWMEQHRLMREVAHDR